jgi:DUF1365 family protein
MGLKENALYLGKVRHARYRPRTHRFTYQGFLGLFECR